MVATLGVAMSFALLPDLPRALADGGGPEMTLAAEGADCEGATCTVGTSDEFTLAVQIVDAPAKGYVGAQAFIDYGTEIEYHATELAADEVIWPDCSPVIASRSELSATTVTHVCLTGFPMSQPVSTYEGTFVALSFSCPETPSSTLVRLLPFGDPFAGTSGSKFILPGDETVAAKVSDLTIDCVSASTPTPTAPPTTTAAPTSTPSPAPTSTGLVGDGSCDGTVNALDAALILQFAAGLLAALPCPQGGDINGDGESNALDAALVLQLSAGLLESLPP